MQLWKVMMALVGVLMAGAASGAWAQTNARPGPILRTDGAPLRMVDARLTHHPGRSQYDNEVRLAFTVTNGTPETVLSLLVHCVIRNPFEEVVFDQQLKLEGVIQPHATYAMDSWWLWRNFLQAEKVYEKLWAIAGNNTARLSTRVVAASFASGRIWYHDSIFMDQVFAQYQQRDDDFRLAAIEGLTNLALTDKDGNGLLHRACTAGVTNLRIYQRLIEKGAAVQHKNAQGQTALHMAPEAGVARALLAAGLPVDARDAQGRTPLMRAVSWGYWPESGNKQALLAYLVNAGADVNARDSHGKSVLEQVRHEDNTAYEFLIAKGARYTLLDTIQRNDQARTGQLLARREGVNLSRFDGQSTWTPLRYAVDKADLELVKRLVLDGANPHYACPKTRINLVHQAVARRSEDILRYLLSLRVAHTTRSSMGTTPLEYAGALKWITGEEILRQFGAR